MTSFYNIVNDVAYDDSRYRQILVAIKEKDYRTAYDIFIPLLAAEDPYALEAFKDA